MKRIIYLSLICFLLSFVSRGQMNAPAINTDDGYTSSFGGGVSYGMVFERDATFWGCTMDYTTLISSRFALISSLTFDRETEKLSKGGFGIVNTFNLVVGVSFLATKNISLTTGLGKGFLDDSNSSRKMKFTSGDLGTGIVFGYMIPNIFKNDRYVLNLSTSLEYNITGSEFTNSYDLGIGYSF